MTVRPAFMLRTTMVLALVSLLACSSKSKTDPEDETSDSGVEPDAALDSGARMDAATDAGELADAGGMDAGPCTTGFTQTGTVCVDIDECAMDRGGCDAHAFCTNRAGYRDCTCEAGYAGDGFTCEAVAVSLAHLRWELPCRGGTPPLCSTTGLVSAVGQMTGEPGKMYDVELRFRGVVETKFYNGGDNDGAFFQIGGMPGSSASNVYALTVEDPAQTFYLNRGPSLLEYCQSIDYTKTIRIAASSTVTLSADPIADQGNTEVINVNMMGMPIVVPDVPPAPLPFDGQFIQMDVISVTPVE